jgi:transposase-like protein
VAGGIHCKKCGYYEHMDLMPSIVVEECPNCVEEKKVSISEFTNCPYCNTEKENLEIQTKSFENGIEVRQYWKCKECGNSFIVEW